jgi:hypothetical protein
MAGKGRPVEVLERIAVGLAENRIVSVMIMPWWIDSWRHGRNSPSHTDAIDMTGARIAVLAHIDEATPTIVDLAPNSCGKIPSSLVRRMSPLFASEL